MEKIYILKKDFDYAYADIVESSNGADSMDLTADNPEMLANYKFGWLTNESEILPNMYIINSDILVCNSNGREIISQYSSCITFNEIKIDLDTYFACFNIPILRNCLNIKKSKIKRFSNGDIMEISSPVLLPKEYPIIFGLEELPTKIFCTNKLKNAIEKNSLTGLKFEECHIKSKSWF